MGENFERNIGAPKEKAEVEKIIEDYAEYIHKNVCAKIPYDKMSRGKDREDVGQEILEAIVKGRKDLKTPEHLKTWINSIIKNRIADFYRKIGKEKEKGEKFLNNTIERERESFVNDDIEKIEIDDLLSRLNPHQKAVAEIIMRDYSGWYWYSEQGQGGSGHTKFNFTSIGKELGISSDAARYRWRRAQKILKNILEKEK